MTTAAAHRLTAVEALGERVRQLIDAVVWTNHPVEEIEQLADELAKITADWTGRTPSAVLLPKLTDLLLNRRTYGPLVGIANPISVPMTIVRGTRNPTRASTTFSRVHQGAPDAVHGGVLAAQFEHLVSHCARAAGRGGPVVGIEIRFHAPVPLGVAIEWTASVAERANQRTLVNARAHVGGAPEPVLASASALVITTRSGNSLTRAASWASSAPSSGRASR